MAPCGAGRADPLRHAHRLGPPFGPAQAPAAQRQGHVVEDRQPGVRDSAQTTVAAASFPVCPRK
ncbi:hypothetical protein GCM10018782_43290 [Streptomyces griseoaurantiacus]|nr:hypothetical protein GCM10018782_43290 [Streptomyces griseoaurantiacus]